MGEIWPKKKSAGRRSIIEGSVRRHRLQLRQYAREGRRDQSTLCKVRDCFLLATKRTHRQMLPKADREAEDAGPTQVKLSMFAQSSGVCGAWCARASCAKAALLVSTGKAFLTQPTSSWSAGSVLSRLARRGARQLRKHHHLTLMQLAISSPPAATCELSKKTS